MVQPRPPTAPGPRRPGWRGPALARRPAVAPMPPPRRRVVTDPGPFRARPANEAPSGRAASPRTMVDLCWERRARDSNPGGRFPALAVFKTAALGHYASPPGPRTRSPPRSAPIPRGGFVPQDPVADLTAGERQPQCPTYQEVGCRRHPGRMRRRGCRNPLLPQGPDEHGGELVAGVAPPVRGAPEEVGQVARHGAGRDGVE